MTLAATDYALLAKDAYRDRKVGELMTLGTHTYAVIAKADNPNTGFQGTAYREANEHKVVIAYRGTEPDRDIMHDGLVDAGMVFIGANGQEADSRKFTENVLAIVNERGAIQGRFDDVSVTGHSLGGTLAEINGSDFKLPGQTFNAYGAAGLYKDRPKIDPGIVNHVRATDPVSAASQHYGEVRVYATPQDIDILKKAGYRPEGSYDILRTVNALDMQSHAIDNFTPANDIQGKTIINADNVSRYLSNRALVDYYRSDVEEIRHHASVTWETHKAVFDGLDRGAAAVMAAGRNTAREVGHAVDQIATSAAHGAHVAARAGVAAGEFGQDVAVTALMPTSAASAINGSVHGSPELDKLLHRQRLDDPSHPGNRLFKQALEGTQRLDAAQGRTPDKLSTHLAGALAVEAQRQGMDRIDHVMLSDDASRAYAVQGQVTSPFKKVAEVQTELGISASIEQSSKAWAQATDQRQQAVMAQAMERAAQAGPEIAQPAPGRTLH